MKFRRFISVLTVASLLLSSVHMTAKTDDVQDYKTQAEYTAETAELNTQKEDTKNVSSTISTVSNATGDIVASGTCGDNLTWELFSDGTLEISGTGSMRDYSSSSSAPWYSNRSSIKKVIIESGVTSIGDYAFYNCSILISVTIPDKVRNIGDRTFSGCSSLTSVTIPDSVTSIDRFAFSGCSSLVKVYITDIAKWCGISFGGDDSNPLCNGANLYLNGELVKDLTIPDGVTKIKDYAFDGCSSLTSVTIPDSVTSIGWYAFSYCSTLHQ